MAFVKGLKDLNLLDRFLFAETMEDPVNLQILLEIILGREVVLKYLPQTEKEQRTSPLYKFVKLDVWAIDEEKTIYDTEPHQEKKEPLPKRSRVYQGMIDSKLLEPGDADFTKLNNVYMIVITPYDVFGEGKYRYTFRMACKEIPGLELGDGAVRIFLNTHGTNDDEVSEELVELLKYMEHTKQEPGLVHSSKVQELQKRVEQIKSSEEVGIRYMQAWEERVLDRQEAREEGREEGIEEGMIRGQYEKLRELVEKKKRKGKTVEEIAEDLEEEEEVIRKIYEEQPEV